MKLCCFVRVIFVKLCMFSLAFAGFSGIHFRLQRSVLSLTLNSSLILISETENFGKMSQYFKIVMRVLYICLSYSIFVRRSKVNLVCEKSDKWYLSL